MYMLCQRQEVSLSTRVWMCCDQLTFPGCQCQECPHSHIQVLRTRFSKGQQGIVQRVLPLVPSNEPLHAIHLPAAAADDVMKNGRTTIVEGVRSLQHICGAPTHQSWHCPAPGFGSIPMLQSLSLAIAAGSMLQQQLGNFMSKPFDLLADQLTHMEVPGCSADLCLHGRMCAAV